MPLWHNVSVIIKESSLETTEDKTDSEDNVKSTTSESDIDFSIIWLLLLKIDLNHSK